MHVHWRGDAWDQLVQLQEEGWASYLKESGNYYQLAIDHQYANQWKIGQLHWNPPEELIPETPSDGFLLDFIYSQGEMGWLGICPGFRIQSWGADKKELRQKLLRQIHESLAGEVAHQRMQSLLVASGARVLGIEQRLLKIQVLGRKSNENSISTEKEALLEATVDPIALHSLPKGLGFDPLLEQLQPLYRGQPLPNVLVIGPSGSGKSIFIYELMRRLHALDPELQFFESNAGKLMKGLVNETGWEDNLPNVWQALASKKGILFLNQADALHQVGQYVGNTSSLGDGLKSLMKTHRVPVMAECTPEALRWMEQKAPGFIQLFYKYRLDISPSRYSSIILQHLHPKSALSQTYQTAVQELLYLQKRFEPYSGQPGKAIRFLEILQKEEPEAPLTISRIRIAYSRQTGIPAVLLDPKMQLDRPSIESRLGQHVFGQAAAIQAVASTLIRLKAGLLRERKPVASFLFVGPTGVGKTELAQQLAFFLFGNRNRLIRFDMSEFTDRSAIYRLVGGQGGKEGLLTSTVRRNPFSVVLLDEIEKGDPRFLDLLLQILGDAQLTDEEGKLTDFGGTVIIITSNVGARRLSQKTIGWNKEDADLTRSLILESELLKVLRPELLNRIDEVVPFAPMTPAVIQQVLNREWKRFLQREGVRPDHIQINLTKEAREQLAEQGFDPKYGARHLQRILRREIYLPLAETLRQLDPEDPLDIQIDWQNKRFQFRADQKELPFSDLVAQLGRVALADQVTSSRKYSDAVKKGPVWNQMENIRKRLDWQSKHQSESFWANSINPIRLRKVEQLLAEFNSHTQAIEALEEETAQVVLDSGDTNLEHQLEEWESDFLDWGRAVYDFIHPEGTQCFVAIVGKRANHPAQWYERLFQKAHFDFQLFHYAASDNATSQKWKKVSYPSVEAMLEQNTEGDIRTVVFQLKGSTVYPFLRPEIGFQKWKMGEDLDRTFSILISMDDSIPSEVNRKSYFLKKPFRRKMDRNQMEDLNWQTSGLNGLDMQHRFVREQLQFELISFIKTFLLNGWISE